jgi:peptidoglycan/LPS O-acetylase OafA/YrhL
MYLFHAFCLTFIEDRVLHPTTGYRYLGVFFLAYLFSLAVASVVYFVIEKPSISWGRILAKRYVGDRGVSIGRRNSEGNHGAEKLPFTT